MNGNGQPMIELLNRCSRLVCEKVTRGMGVRVCVRVCVCMCEGRGWWGFCCPCGVNRTGADGGVSEERCVGACACVCVCV